MISKGPRGGRACEQEEGGGEEAHCCWEALRPRGAFEIIMDSDVVTSTHIYGYAEALQPPITAGGGAATDAFNVLVRGTS